MIDGRWRGYTGVGRVTDLFLRGLRDLGGSYDWRVWTRIDDEASVGLPTVPTGHAPTSFMGQRDLRSVPAADAHLWLHAVRPLTTKAWAVLVHDLIPVTRYPQPHRMLWNQYFRRSVAAAGRVLVYSAATKDRIESLLGIPPDRIHRFDLTIDRGLADRARARRKALAADGDAIDGHVLYVGQFKAHKNLDRLMMAFARSAASTDGRPLVLVGGRAEECSAVRQSAVEHGVRTVRVVERCSDDELTDLYAGAAALVQPSLEEGFGLTVLEALVAGVPVACSSIPTHREASRGEASFFDPKDIDSMAAAIDAAVVAPRPAAPSVPTLAEFAADLLRAADLPLKLS